MAEKKIYYDQDLNENKLKKARVEMSGSHDDDAVNRKFVLDQHKYDTTLATTLPTAEKMGGIAKGTPSATVANKTFKQILDLALYPLVAPTYTKPTITASITNIGGDSNDNIIPIAGFKKNVVLKAVATQNDSASITSYTFSGAGISGTVTQASDTYTVSGYTLVNGDNTWTVGVNYTASTTKNNSHGVADATGSFTNGSITTEVKLSVKDPIMYGVDYGVSDVTTMSGSNVQGVTESVIPNDGNSFKIEIGNTRDVSVNIAIPYDNADIRVIMNDVDITNAFKRSVKTGVKPWGEGNHTYSVFHWHSGLKLNKPTTIEVTVFYRYYTRIVDVIWDGQDNLVKIDNTGSYTTSWNFETNTPIGTNIISIGRQSNGDIRMVSSIGNIKRIEKGRPFKVYENLNSADITISDQEGRSVHLNYGDTYKFRLWVQEGDTSTNSLFENGLFQNSLFE